MFAHWLVVRLILTVACGKPPGIRQPQVGHPPMGRPLPRTTPAMLPVSGAGGRSFVIAQQLRDACCKWLMAQTRDIEEVIDLVVLEQFIAQLPRRTELPEDHLVVCPGVGKNLPHVSLQPFSLYFSSLLPVSSYPHFKIAEQLAHSSSTVGTRQPGLRVSPGFQTWDMRGHVGEH